MAKLFLDGIFDMSSDSPSTIRLGVPLETSGNQREVLRGLIIGEPSFSAQNKWGPIINDLSNLSDFSSLMGSSSLFSWVSASTMCWKGTTPLNIGVEFYLINYKKGLNLRENLKNLVKLASLNADPDATDLGQNFKVKVHGGYAASVLESNKDIFNNMDFKDLKDFKKENIPFSRDEAGNIEGSVWISFGHSLRIKNLLLTKIDVVKSTVEVADQMGTNIEPLYYRVSASFTGIKPLITTDVDYMFS